jgi:DNA-binding PadR family transcriptional regulator
VSTTTLGHALLGLLARESLSGYDLTRLMRARVGFFWQARHSQIYPELARLEGNGLVTHVVVEQQDRPDKKVYEITAAGQSALKEWVTRPVEQRAARDELVLKAYSMWLADPERAVALFREERGSWMEKEWAEDLHRLDSPRFASYAALQRGIVYERGYAEWCGWVADQLERGIPGEGADS